jgi:hypothetical protein
MQIPGRLEENRPHFDIETKTLEQYLSNLRPKDRIALETVIFPVLKEVLPKSVRGFAVGSSIRYADYRDIDIHIGAEHEEVSTIARLCHSALESNPRITFQETTKDRDPSFTSLIPIGFSVTVDSPHKIVSKEEAREAYGLFDFAIMRYNNWKKIEANGNGILLF